MSPLKKQARVAGLLYALACGPTPFAILYVPNAVLVPGNAAATADNVRTYGHLVRMAIGGEVASSILMIFAVVAFYRLFRGVSERLALVMALAMLVSVPVVLLNVVNHLAALTLVSGARFLGAFDRDHLDALTYFFLRLHGRGLNVAQVFWGLWLFPLGLLVIRSRFIPGFIGVLLMVAGTGYLASAFTSLLLPPFLPHYARAVSQVATALAFGEVPFVVWLLGWGARVEPAGSRALDSEGRVGAAG